MAYLGLEMIMLLPFLLVTIATYPLMRLAGYDPVGSFLFSLCSPIIFAFTGGAFVLLGAPFSFEVISLLNHLGHPDALTREQANFFIAACGYIAGLYIIARRIRRENGKKTPEEVRTANVRERLPYDR
jgi:hypothetical protein